MRKSSSLALALAIALIGASPRAHVYVGIQGFIAAGAHTDIAGKQSGIAGGALLQFGLKGKRVGLHVEGIPPVSLPQAPSSYYGQATPQLSIINGEAQFAVDPSANWWVGFGSTVINQRTPLPNLSQVVASRLAGARYALMYRRYLSASRFVEIDLGAAPHLTGADHFTYSVPSPEIDKPEIAAEEDAQIAYGITRGNTQWLVGLRSIGFSARYALTGAAADRNNGGGPLLELRQFVH
ncbi:MAG TPA: hypothetical protein VKT72_04625 [Candidatus Baltobacteraceae bacterium]|nr:hypothetical protein [Candidatus Baltobacteraceae bacterium]